MGQQLSVRTISTISVASTALPKSRSLSMQNCLASPCLPSSISCWCGVNFIFLTVIVVILIFVSVTVDAGPDSLTWLVLASDRDGGLVADLGCVDLDPVAGLDGRDRVQIQLVNGRDLSGNGAVDIDVVDL